MDFGVSDDSKHDTFRWRQPHGASEPHRYGELVRRVYGDVYVLYRTPLGERRIDAGLT